MFEIMNVDAALLEFGIPHQIAMQWNICADAIDQKFIQRDLHTRERLCAGCAIGNQLADQRIVIRWNRITAVHMRIYANTGAAWRVKQRHLAGTGQESGWIFGIDAAFERMTLYLDIFLGD